MNSINLLCSQIDNPYKISNIDTEYHSYQEFHVQVWTHIIENIMQMEVPTYILKTLFDKVLCNCFFKIPFLLFESNKLIWFWRCLLMLFSVLYTGNCIFLRDAFLCKIFWFQPNWKNSVSKKWFYIVSIIIKLKKKTHSKTNIFTRRKKGYTIFVFLMIEVHFLSCIVYWCGLSLKRNTFLCPCVQCIHVYSYCTLIQCLLTVQCTCVLILYI